MIDKQVLREKIIEEIKHAEKRSNNAMCIGKDITTYLLEVLEEHTDYNKGLNDAWELVKRIIGIVDKENHELIPARELTKIYGSNDLLDIFAFTPQEALAKLKAYEEEQEIKVGDVVEFCESGEKYLIISEEDDRDYNFGVINLQSMKIDRICTTTFAFKKTGKHLDISSILEQIGE